LRDFEVKIEKVKFSLLPSTLDILNVSFKNSSQDSTQKQLEGNIQTIKFKGISLLNALFKRDIIVEDLQMSNCNILGEYPKADSLNKAILTKLNIQINRVFLDSINLEIFEKSNSRSLKVTNAKISFVHLNFKKADTISVNHIAQIECSVHEIKAVSRNNFYSYFIKGLQYSETNRSFTAKNFTILPNYSDAVFALKHELQVDRLDATFDNIELNDFKLKDFLTNEIISTSKASVNSMNIRVFHDKRRKAKHKIANIFQELIYKYPHALRIDTISVSTGNIVYLERNFYAPTPGKIFFEKVHAKIINVNNDTIYKSKPLNFQLFAQALLMGKGKLEVELSAPLFDKNNIFKMKGTLDRMDARELNPALENLAFMQIKTGNLISMSFNFRADNTKALGKMLLKYDNLKLKIINKKTNKTNGLKEAIISYFTNRQILNSNPLPGSKSRSGIINYKRNPEKFIFHYWYKSAFTGILSSIKKQPKKHRTLIQKLFGKPKK